MVVRFSTGGFGRRLSSFFRNFSKLASNPLVEEVTGVVEGIVLVMLTTWSPFDDSVEVADGAILLDVGFVWEG